VAALRDGKHQRHKPDACRLGPTGRPAAAWGPLPNVRLRALRQPVRNQRNEVSTRRTNAASVPTPAVPGDRSSRSPASSTETEAQRGRFGAPRPRTTTRSRRHQGTSRETMLRRLARTCWQRCRRAGCRREPSRRCCWGAVVGLLTGYNSSRGLAMSNTDTILAYIKTTAPLRSYAVTIEKIRAGTSVNTHQQVFQITRRLRETGRINGEMVGGEWHFWAKP
jgi:hypothetical protein